MYPSHPDFGQRILPAIGLFVIPVLETPEGEIVQDSTDIIDYLEARFPEPCFIPETPIQRTLASLLCAFGSEGMLQPSMHYRWSFLEQHGDYIRAEFGRAMSQSRDRAERDAMAEPSMAMMAAHLVHLGISETTIPAIEAAYIELLEVLEAHFMLYPYLLGGRPSMADFGFMVGLYAHLSRDPVPAALMKARAPNVYRWCERMNCANIDDGEFPDAADAFLSADTVPETLEAVLTVVFKTWGPELQAFNTRYNEWVSANQDLPDGHLVSLSDQRQVHPSLGSITYAYRGVEVTRQCFPHALWHFERVAAEARQLKGSAQVGWNTLMQRCGGVATMQLTLDRPVKRLDNVLVLD
jgi:glutathione S-transferase